MIYNATLKTKTLLIVLVFSCMTISVNEVLAQVIFFNNGAQIFTGATALVQINGGLQNDGATAVIDHNGTMTIANSSTPGDIVLSNNSLTQGNGTYLVEQDWMNNAFFVAGNSTVELFGSTTQLITSTNATNTTFNNLTLTGTGTAANRVKQMTLDATVANVLVLNDRELATDNNTMFVTNSAIGAVTNNATPGIEGFVSSLGNGSLSREVLANLVYLFPTGSSLVTTKYRPAEITPNNTGTFTVRMVNNNATIDGFNTAVTDAVVCVANPNFYHKINRTVGTAFADISLAFDPASDGPWTKMANWEPLNQWTDMVTTAAATIGSLSAVKRPLWQNFLVNPNDPYILTEVRPDSPSVSGDQLFCSNASGAIYTASGNPNGTYTWTVNGGTIVSDSTSQTITVNWGNNTSGSITVIENTSSGFCSSTTSSTFNITLSPSPNAGYDTLTSGPLSQLIAFNDTTQGATSWFWDFGNGITSTQQNPAQNFPVAGTYPVMLIVENAAGCTDTVYGEIVINEDILIPNVFSPNGDGTNDMFYIPNTGLGEFSIQIFNRWGTMIWETQAPEIRWDGRTTAGVMVASGTYYYILKAISSHPSKEDWSRENFITVFK